jgi:glycolate oxidase FAD binding subunit
MSEALSIAGVVPATVLEPADRAELAATVRELYARGQTYAFAGGGTELELGNTPHPLDALVRTTALNRVIDYSPQDQTITVEAGMRIATLDMIVAEHDQWLPLDVGDRTNATVGGAIATNAFGARRHRYGSIKDLIVGVEFVRPDGVIAHGGGKVVKNVAGFDLPKLMVGSLGTLGAVTSATFRVFPRPQYGRAVLLQASPEHKAFAGLLNDRALEPIAVVHYPALGGVVVTFMGESASVEAQVAQAVSTAQACGAACGLLDGAGVASAVAFEAAVRSAGEWRWTTRRPTAPHVPLALEVGYPTLGVTLGSADDGAPMDELIASRGGSVVFRAMPPRARGRVDAWGEPPPSFPLMRALKTNFDPKGLCNPGRFVGGL